MMDPTPPRACPAQRLQGTHSNPYKTHCPARCISADRLPFGAFLHPADPVRRRRFRAIFWRVGEVRRDWTAAPGRAREKGSTVLARLPRGDRVGPAQGEGRSLRLFAEGFCLPELAPTPIDDASRFRRIRVPAPLIQQNRSWAGQPNRLVRPRARVKRTRSAAKQQSHWRRGIPPITNPQSQFFHIRIF